MESLAAGVSYEDNSPHNTTIPSYCTRVKRDLRFLLGDVVKKMTRGLTPCHASFYSFLQALDCSSDAGFSGTVIDVCDGRGSFRAVFHLCYGRRSFRAVFDLCYGSSSFHADSRLSMIARDCGHAASQAPQRTHWSGSAPCSLSILRGQLSAFATLYKDLAFQASKVPGMSTRCGQGIQ